MFLSLTGKYLPLSRIFPVRELALAGASTRSWVAPFVPEQFKKEG